MTHDASNTVSEGWRQALDAFIASRLNEPFAWGTNDCVMFAADAIVAMGGEDNAKHVRGTYSTAMEAERMLRDLGGLQLLARSAGTEKPSLMATQGDIGLVGDGGRQLLAVCIGTAWVAPGATGLSVIPFESALAAWSVSHG